MPGYITSTSRFTPGLALSAALTLAATFSPVLAQQVLPPKPTQLANPASQYCINNGGILGIERGAQGGEVGICRFPGNRQCEEWAMFRGECPLGGLPVPLGAARPAQPTPPPGQPIRAVFNCKNGLMIAATFMGGTQPSVYLELSDGRKLTVPAGLSGSGARYATPDERFVFWNKGDSAFIQENGATTYDDCQARP